MTEGPRGSSVIGFSPPPLSWRIIAARLDAAPTHAAEKGSAAMFKKLLIGGAILGGVAAFVLRKRRGSGYDDDEIDSADYGDFGDRGAPAPEQQMATAETRHDTTPEELSTAARVETSLEDIRAAFPGVSDADVKSAEGDLDRLAGLIAEKTGGERGQVRQRLQAIIDTDTPDPSYPAH